MLAACGHSATMPSVLNIKDSEEIRARLDPLRRFVLVLCGIAKKSYTEVAAQPGISRRAVEGAYCVAFDALESDIVRETGARTYMHALDIPIAESGGPFRPLRAAPGLLRRVMCKLFFHPDERVAPIAIDQPLTPGEMLPIAGGIEVIPTPGHCAGQVALLWRPGRMLFAGDVCMNVMGLGDPVGFESLEEGRASQRKVASLSFDHAGFGHGEPIAHDASTRFLNTYGKHPEDVHQQRSAA